MGHAYYGNYLFWFEQARGKWCRDRGFTYRQMEELGFFMPVIEAHVNYRDEVLYDDVIVVKVWTKEIRRTKITFEYEIYNSNTGKLCTTGHTVHVVMGKERKAISIPAVLREWMDREPQNVE